MFFSVFPNQNSFNVFKQHVDGYGVRLFYVVVLNLGTWDITSDSVVQSLGWTQKMFVSFASQTERL